MIAEPTDRAPACGSTPEDLLAATSFGIPELVSCHVHRPRLLDVLARATSLPLVLVSSPAGTGKTSLVAEWVRSSGEAGTTGWITFEEDETGFWGSVLECLSRLGLDVPTPDWDRAADTAPGKQHLMTLAARITGAPQLLTVVLDGYRFESLELARDVDFLLRHTVGHLRLVFVGRVDPVLPLYRYRLADTLLEIRAADLAFTDEEASQLMTGLGVSLSSASIHDLNERTKGWVAGLRFAARTLVSREDPEESVATVVGQTSDINEYLVGEVLDAQAPEVRRFLLDTSVLDMLCPGVVEELCGASALRTLGELTTSNAFLEPVPDRPSCFRYYPFFRDLLQAQLAYELPQAMVDLHRRAAQWFQREGFPDRSISHLATIEAWDEIAAQIVNGLLIGRLLLEDRGGPLRSAAQHLPADLDQVEVCVLRAAVALTAGDESTCAEELSAARRTAQAEATLADAVAVSISVLDAVRACFSDDAESATCLAEDAERALSAWQPSSRTTPASEPQALVQFSKGVAMIRRGDLPGARKALTSAAGLDAARSFPSLRADCLGYLAIVEALEGHLSRSSRTADESVTVAANAHVPLADRSPAAQVALACVALEQYELKGARDHVAAAMTARAFQHDPISRCLAVGVVASLERANGRLQPALVKLEAAAASAAPADPWLADYLRIEAAKLSLASGRTELAQGALESLERTDVPESAVVAAAAFVEQNQAVAVEDCLARARAGAPPLRVRVTGLLLEAVQESRRRSPGRARVVLDRSLRLAAPEGLRRPFREAGPAVQRLLSADSRLLLENRWLSRPAGVDRAIPHQREHAKNRADRNGNPDVVEALTIKELEVLGHLEELLTTEEIAEKMFVSVNTVRTHVRSILRKLGVSRRNAAVRRARDLGIVKT